MIKYTNRVKLLRFFQALNITTIFYISLFSWKHIVRPCGLHNLLTFKISFLADNLSMRNRFMFSLVFRSLHTKEDIISNKNVVLSFCPSGKLHFRDFCCICTGVVILTKPCTYTFTSIQRWKFLFFIHFGNCDVLALICPGATFMSGTVVNELQDG